MNIFFIGLFLFIELVIACLVTPTNRPDSVLFVNFFISFVLAFVTVIAISIRLIESVLNLANFYELKITTIYALGIFFRFILSMLYPNKE